MTRKSVGIIGAGASGIGVARSLRKAGIDFEIIEATGQIGGNWQSGGPASKMYDSAHLISSKQNTQFIDHPMPAAYPVYPRHDLFHSYLKDLASASDIPRHTRFNTTVTAMTPDNGGWRLVFQDGSDAGYDVVVLCNGLLRKPLSHALAAQATCETMHAVNYKSADGLKGKRVLVVGGGNSGCDIAVDATRTARSVFHSTRRGYHYMPKFIDGRPTQDWLMDESQKFPDSDSYWDHVRQTFKLAGFRGEDYGLPAPDHPIQACHPIMNSQILYHIGHGDIIPKPDLHDLHGDTVTFRDGTTETIDVIVWACGYTIDMPFLDRSLFDWSTEIPSLFLRMIPATFDNLLFVGYLNSPSGIGNLVNTMARFVTSYIAGRKRDTEAWRTVRRMAESHTQLDLGQGRFMSTARHEVEVDLWKFLRSVNFVTSKLQGGMPGPSPAEDARLVTV
ncbi:MAG: NAD(P)-binding domain-containing protein [Beijerinckiaceae bacterium]|nr:NAD(P)-binding domain-containing protein [Beijerinckiaceae bacterium]